MIAADQDQKRQAECYTHLLGRRGIVEAIAIERPVAEEISYGRVDRMRSLPGAVDIAA